LYPAKYQLKEKIATGLKSDLSKKDLKLLGDVIHLTGYDEFKIWLDNIAILYNKKSRLKVSSHEGDLTVNPFINKMLENKFKDKYLSITELESYAFCPMQFFLKYILNLQEEREIEEKITPLEKGLLLHKILFQFYATLKQRKLQARPWENLDLLLTIAQGEFDRLPYQGLLWQLEKEEYFGFEKKEGLFKTFLALEKKEIEERGFIPAHFEVAFGISPDEDKYDQVSSERPFIIRKEGQREIKLSGKIDRIDLDSSGNLIVYDYKIGRIAEQIKMSHIFNGTSLQLPVYLAAINDMLRDYYKKIYPVGGVYYQIKDSENCAKYPVIIDGEKIRDMNKRRDAKLPNPKFTLNGKALSFWEIINHTLEFVMKYVQAITQGNFRHTHHPSDMRCSQYCEFAMICRKDVNKLKVMNFDIC
jgi:ATP-dependent helicase/nuclease subunit B